MFRGVSRLFRGVSRLFHYKFVLDNDNDFSTTLAAARVRTHCHWGIGLGLCLEQCFTLDHYGLRSVSRVSRVTAFRDVSQT